MKLEGTIATSTWAVLVFRLPTVIFDPSGFQKVSCVCFEEFHYDEGFSESGCGLGLPVACVFSDRRHFLPPVHSWS